MILNDAEITQRIKVDNLVANHDPAGIVNCRYNLRIGKVFEPESGREILPNIDDKGRTRNTCIIGPAEALIVMTEESLRMPSSLCGWYSPLHRHARHGIMLLSGSVVEPGYEGPLSCYLVNFSSTHVRLTRYEEIAKICFQVLTDEPSAPKPFSRDPVSYESALADDARLYHRSFLDVSGIEERAADRAKNAVKNWVIVGGVLVALLIAFATLEPLLSNWIWQKTGYQDRLKAQRVFDDLLVTGSKPLAELRRDQAELKSEYERLAEALRILGRQQTVPNPNSSETDQDDP